MEKCIGCELCAGVCPAKCIYVRGKDNDPRTPPRPASASGSSTRSTTCGASTATCASRRARPRRSPRASCSSSASPTADAIYTKAELVVDDDGKPQQLPWEDWREGEDRSHLGWMRATAPGGDADFVGQVGWSGELGYGVRPPSTQTAVADDARPCATTADGPRAEATDMMAARSSSSSAPPRWCCSVPSGHRSLRNPVHAALSLVLTLFGIAVLFVAQEAHFLAAVQVIVYAGAIVVLFLFVIMLLGVDQAEDLQVEPLGSARRAVVGAGTLALVGLLAVVRVDAVRRSPPELGVAPPTLAADPDGAQHRGSSPAGAVHRSRVRLRDRVGAAGHRRRRRGAAGPRRQARSAERAPPIDAGTGSRRGERRPLADAPTATWYLARCRAVLHRRGRRAGPPQPAGHVHVRRADAQRRQPHVRGPRPRARRHRGRSIVFFVLVVAAAEVVVGLGIIVAILRRRQGPRRRPGSS
jgi:ferredoxin